MASKLKRQLFTVESEESDDEEKNSVKSDQSEADNQGGSKKKKISPVDKDSLTPTAKKTATKKSQADKTLEQDEKPAITEEDDNSKLVAPEQPPDIYDIWLNMTGKEKNEETSHEFKAIKKSNQSKSRIDYLQAQAKYVDMLLAYRKKKEAYDLSVKKSKPSKKNNNVVAFEPEEVDKIFRHLRRIVGTALSSMETVKRDIEKVVRDSTNKEIV